MLSPCRSNCSSACLGSFCVEWSSRVVYAHAGSQIRHDERARRISAKHQISHIARLCVVLAWTEPFLHQDDVVQTAGKSIGIERRIGTVHAAAQPSSRRAGADDPQGDSHRLPAHTLAIQLLPSGHRGTNAIRELGHPIRLISGRDARRMWRTVEGARLGCVRTYIYWRSNQFCDICSDSLLHIGQALFAFSGFNIAMTA